MSAATWYLTIRSLRGSWSASREDKALMERFMQVKRRNKAALAAVIGNNLGIKLDPSSLFDIQIKRIHEYKRQLLNALETIGLYLAIRDEPNQQLDAARQDLRRQGGRQLPSGQADHQADQRHRSGGQQRSLDPRPAEGRVRAELQCHRRRGAGAGLRPVRADLDRRHGGVRHRQHEACARTAR